MLIKGYQLSVIDQDNISTGASFINSGYLVPSHFIPLAESGIISQGLKWMLNSASPFFVKPRLDLEFLNGPGILINQPPFQR
jgi:D-amino-acid dehydrogenase